MILPILILLSVVAFDFSRYILYLRKVALASSTMAELIARNDTGKISQADILAFSRAQLVIFPEAMQSARGQGKSVWDITKWSLSGVQFKTTANCTSNCTYTPYVAWSSGKGRPCAVPLLAAADTDPPAPTTLPTDTFGPNFLIVADVVFTYTPVVAQSIIGTVNIAKSFYVPPRYVSAIAFDTSAGSTSAWACTVP
ncbi:hypothetical protein G3T14_13190 [Methylobacterium sp. BTF04]|nr:hypothetical protein [Methylobacterium sp. BTF04]